MGETCPLCGEELGDARSLPTHLPQCPAELDGDLDDGDGRTSPPS